MKSTVHKPHFTERPLAAPGLTSFRYKLLFGYVMIGARDEEDALNEAGRSIETTPQRERLEVWNGEMYVGVAHA